jgi:hypothetical protein
VPIPIAFLVGLFLALAGAAQPVPAQLHEKTVGGYVVHANVVNSTCLPQNPEVLARHGIQRSSDRVLLNVVAREAGKFPRETLRSTVAAKTAEMGGYTRDIDMLAKGPVREDQSSILTASMPFMLCVPLMPCMPLMLCMPGLRVR